MLEEIGEHNSDCSGWSAADGMVHGESEFPDINGGMKILFSGFDIRLRICSTVGTRRI